MHRTTAYFSLLIILVFLGSCSGWKREGLPESQRKYKEFQLPKIMPPINSVVEFQHLNAEKVTVKLHEELIRLFGKNFDFSKLDHWIKHEYFLGERHKKRMWRIADSINFDFATDHPDNYTYLETGKETIELDFMVELHPPGNFSAKFPYRSTYREVNTYHSRNSENQKVTHTTTHSSSITTDINKLLFNADLVIDITYNPRNFAGDKLEYYRLVIPDSVDFYTVFDLDDYNSKQGK